MRFWVGMAGLAISAMVLAGSRDSGGGDNHSPDFGAAWFTGDRVIRFCSAIEPGFGVSPVEANRTVERAFTTWRAYILGKDVHGSSQSKQKGMFLATKWQALPACDGTEDLTFYFGVSTARVAQAKATFENPTAFAERVSYDPKSGWGKGFVWLAMPGTVYPGANTPDWTLPYRLEGALLHELGHIYGCDHVNGTIMDENLTSRLQGSAMAIGFVKWKLTQIDDWAELFIGPPCAFAFDGTLSYGSYQDEEPFRLLTGRAPSGKVRARAECFNEELTVRLTDDAGSTELKLPAAWGWGSGTSFAGQAKVFKIARSLPSSGGIGLVGENYLPTGKVEISSVTGASGESYPVMVERNADNLGGPLRIEFLARGKTLPLFHATIRQLP